MTPEELAAIRERVARCLETTHNNQTAYSRMADRDRAALLAEVERLRGERDAAKSFLVRHIAEKSLDTALVAGMAVDKAVEVIAEMLRADPDLRASTAETRLSKVRALHKPGPIAAVWGKSVSQPDDFPVCVECTDVDNNWCAYPCPTIQALDGSDQ